jgi:TatD DNase family protein
MLIDSHTHLDHCREDAAELVADPPAPGGAGVGLIVQCGTDLERSRRSVELAERFPEVVAVVGYHPQEAATIDDAGFAEVQGWTAHSRVVAVGETGFDYYHDHCPHDVQREAFVRQIDLARRAALPVVVHTRDAAEDTLAVLAEHAQGLTVILHCFSLPERLAKLVANGYYLSFAGNVTYTKATDLQEAVRGAPADLLLLETDAPWLAPEPLRGRANRPGLVAKTYEFVAGLRGVTVEELAEQVEANALRAFPRLATALGAQS